MWKLLCFYGAIALILPNPWLWATSPSSTGPKNNYVRATLLAEQEHLVPGSWIGIGLHFSIEPNWHLYWQFPGDSGQEPKVRWRLPQDSQIEALTWPMPKVIRVGPLVNYGYEQEVLLATKIRLPETFELHQEVTIEADLTWLVCAHVCVPGKDTVRLQLPVGNTEQPSQHADLFARFRQLLPQPMPPQQQVQAIQQGKSLLLEFMPPLQASAFFPLLADQIAHGSQQELHHLGDRTQLRLAISGMRQIPLEQLIGIVVDGSQQPERSYAIQLAVQQRESINTLSLLWLAFLGGLLLNLMPCVFPVLSLKIISLLRLQPQEKPLLGQHALDYTTGILLSFWALAILLRLLQQIGHQLGWGFQLQSPVFVAGLAGFFFLLGLNMLGVLEFGGSLMGIGQQVQQRSDRWGTVMTGFLATVVATPCSAPFMGTAMGYAMTATLPVNLLIFTFLGLGLACPYVLLCLRPGWMVYLPKSGAWMVYLKEGLSFTLFGTAVWLIWIFSQQQTQWALIVLLVDLWAIGLSSWFLFRFSHRPLWVRLGWLTMVMIFAHLLWAAGPPSHNALADPTLDNPSSSTRVYDGTIVAQLQAEGNMVLVDFTAAWCVTCQINEKFVLQQPAMQQFFKDHHVVIVKADWTNYDEEITKVLASFGRNAIPFYLLYSNNPTVPPEILSDLLKEQDVQGAIFRAAQHQRPAPPEQQTDSP